MLYISGADRKSSDPSKQRARNRLQKRSHGRNPSKNREALYLRKDQPEMLQTCLALFPPVPNDDDDYATLVNQEICSMKNHENSLKNKLSFPSIYSESVYSDKGRQMDECARRRAKTPVLFIGQLERGRRDTHVINVDADDLAKEYRDVLPKREPTPFYLLDTIEKPRKTLRKIKCQEDLRDLIKTFSGDEDSAAETLVGSGSEASSPPESPTYRKSGSGFFPYPELHSSDSQSTLDSPPPEETLSNEKIGFNIALDLLTSDLTSAFVKHHPVEKLNRASGLQIWLMIEAYEGVKERLNEEMKDDGYPDHVLCAQTVLEHWIQALYSVYDQTRMKRR